MSEATAAPRSLRRLLSLDRAGWNWMIPAAAVCAILPFVVRRVGDPDYFWHVLTGQWMVQHRALPRSELFTYTVSGAPYTDQEYGTQLVFYALRRIGGLVLVSVFFAALAWAGFWLLFARIRERRYSPVIAAASLLLGAGAGFPLWGPRPQMFDFLFISLELLWLERFLAGRSRAINWLPLVVIVWANLHGGFVFAFFILGLTLAAEFLRWFWEHRPSVQVRGLRRLTLIAAASVVCSVITPWTLSLHAYVLRTWFSSQLSSFVREWQSPDFHSANMLPFGAMLVILFVGMALRRPPIRDVLLSVGAAILALRAWLFIPVFVAVATPLIAWMWSDIATAAAERIRQWHSAGSPAWFRRACFGALCLAATAGVAVSAHTLTGQAVATRQNYPVGAADWLDAHPTVGTRMFNEYAFGGYLAYRFYPEKNRRVFIYGETELMGDPLLAEYVDLNQVHSNWSAVLDKYGVDYIVFPPDTPLAAVLDASGRWRRVYADDVAVIFVRAT
jgi:hypothetical protein